MIANRLTSAASGFTVAIAAAYGTAPVAVRAQETPSLKALTIALAQSGRPTGLVASIDQFEALERQRSSGVRDGLTDRELIDLAKARTDFILEERGKAVRLVQKGAPIEMTQLLERPGFLAAPVRMSASAAVVHVVGGLLQQRDTGVLGSGPAPQPGCDIDVPVSLPDGPTDARELLDKIAAQGRGLAWFVLYDPENSSRLDLGLWCADGMYFRVQLGSNSYQVDVAATLRQQPPHRALEVQRPRQFVVPPCGPRRSGAGPQHPAGATLIGCCSRPGRGCSSRAKLGARLRVNRALGAVVRVPVCVSAAALTAPLAPTILQYLIAYAGDVGVGST